MQKGGDQRGGAMEEEDVMNRRLQSRMALPSASITNQNKQQPQQQQQQQQQHLQEPQQCPRCDSFNTKFCYYNNYSLSQPRFFCKACRRYWTRGGTLRNVPIGGGCRKGKRTKPSSSSVSSSSSGGELSSRSHPLPPQQHMQPQQDRYRVLPSFTASSSSSPAISSSSSLRVVAKPPPSENHPVLSQMMASYYTNSGGGGSASLLSSLSTIQSSFNQNQPQAQAQTATFSNQVMNNYGGCFNNLGLVQGLEGFPSFVDDHHQSQQQLQQEKTAEPSLLVPPPDDQCCSSLISVVQPMSRPLNIQEWNQSFNVVVNNTLNPTTTTPAPVQQHQAGNFWTGIANTANSSSINPSSSTHWSAADLP